VNVISLGFRTDLMLRTIAGSTLTDHGSHLVVRTPANPGFWWGNFVLFKGPPQDGDAQSWARTFSEEFPRAAHLALGVDSIDGDTGDPGELAALGLEAEVNSVLTAGRLLSPGEPRVAADIRPLAGDDDWAQATRLHIACNDDFAMTPEHRQFLERRDAERRTLCEAGHGAWFGAFVDGRMCAGAGLFSDGSGPARFQDVETHPSHRRQGLASSLVHQAGQWGLQRLGARTLVIVADPGYHAIRLYRSLGFVDAERQVQLSRPPSSGDDHDA